MPQEPKNEESSGAAAPLPKDPNKVSAKLSKKKKSEKMADNPERSNSPTETESSPAPCTASRQFQPETLAHLALQLLQPELPNMRDSDRQLSVRSFDNTYRDALKRADWLLKVAADISDEEVHAYQLFDKDSEPMSFGSIAQRFAEVSTQSKPGFNAVRNTIGDLVEELLKEAQKIICDGIEYYETLLSLNLGFAIELGTLRRRIRRHMTSVIRRTKLNRVVKDLDVFAEQAAHDFIERIKMGISSLRDPWCGDNSICPYGYKTFIEYVCDGLSYEEFMGPGKAGMKLSPDDASTILVYLNNVASGSIPLPRMKDAFKKLNSLIQHRSNIPKKIADDMNVCCELLDSDEPDMNAVKECATRAAAALEPVLDHGFFCKVWERLSVTALKQALVEHLETVRSEQGNENDLHYSALELIRPLISALDEASLLAKPDAAPVARAKYLDLLDEVSYSSGILLNELKEPKLSDELDVLLQTFETAAIVGLRASPVGECEYRRRLDDLLSDQPKLSSTRTRKVRPYYIFLFAAQSGLKKDKLLRRSSDLAPSFRMNPRADFFMPILRFPHGPWMDV